MNLNNNNEFETTSITSEDFTAEEKTFNTIKEVVSKNNKTESRENLLRQSLVDLELKRDNDIKTIRKNSKIKENQVNEKFKKDKALIEQKLKVEEERTNNKLALELRKAIMENASLEKIAEITAKFL